MLVPIHMDARGLSKCTHVSSLVYPFDKLRLLPLSGKSGNLGKLGPGQFLRTVQPMRHPPEVHLAHVETITQDTPYMFVMDAQHLYDLF
jgi:hypothetical protein